MNMNNSVCQEKPYRFTNHRMRGPQAIAVIAEKRGDVLHHFHPFPSIFIHFLLTKSQQISPHGWFAEGDEGARFFRSGVPHHDPAVETQITRNMCHGLIQMAIERQVGFTWIVCMKVTELKLDRMELSKQGSL